MNSLLRVGLLTLLCNCPLLAQSTTRMKIDFGHLGTQTQTSVPQTWNNVHQSNWTIPFELLDTTGEPTGWRFAVRTGTGFYTENQQGTTSPEGVLAAFPVTATRDSLVNRWTQGAYHPTIPQGTSTKAVIELTQLDRNTVYDFVFAGSRMNVGEVRTVDYAVRGFNGGLTTLDVANNTSRVAEVAGILPDASGRIHIAVETSSSNETPERFFYIGAMDIRAVTSRTRPRILAFDQPGIRASRPQGQGPFTVDLTAVESLEAMPAVTLNATDLATGQPPTWMTVPQAAIANSAFGLTLDGSALGQGIYRAIVSGSAAGYPGFDVDVELVVRDPAIKNVLFYGNSFTAGQGCNSVTVPQLFQSIAEEAGHPSPNVVARLVGSTFLTFHLNNPVHAAAIGASLRIGETWDTVVLQGFSTEATETLGNPAQFRADAAAIFANVRAHSPNANVVMFQTWARAPGHSFYPNSFSGPIEMHEQVRRNYRLCVDVLNEQFGSGSASLAAVGDAIALHGFDPAIYCPDLYHGGPPLTTTAAMVIFTSVYGNRTCEVSPNFVGSSNFATQMQTFGLNASDWCWLSGIADRVAEGSVRWYPGSGEDVLLRTGSDQLTACGLKRLEPGDHVLIQLQTPAGTYNGAPAMIYADIFPIGSPPGPLFGTPEIHYNPSTAFVLTSTSSLAGQLTGVFSIPPGMLGSSLLVQGHLLAPSVETGNAFTTTDAHEIRVRLDDALDALDLGCK